MATEVELSGMTINLVPDKETYDGMIKNPNEMYLVQNDYDMIVDVHTAPDAILTESSSYVVTIEYGSTASIIQKLDADPNYVPIILIKWKIYYGTECNECNEICTPWRVWTPYDVVGNLCIHTHWSWFKSHVQLILRCDGSSRVSLVFGW